VCKDFSPSKIFVIFAPKMKHLLTVIAVLLAFACCTTEADRNRMEALLDKADSMNRAYIPMTDGIDSLLLDATRFYDRHGTADQQVRAHYLLGCAYRDMGEAPAALQSYQDAIDRADTLSSDCDYRRLMSVYGQMAELFHAQNLSEDELEQRQKIGSYALQIGDTLLYIRSLELLAKPYYLMRDTSGILRVLNQAHDFYARYGYYHEASSVYPLIIDVYISRDSLEAAKRLMDIFETESGLFDSEGNISAGREDYYEIKGVYYNKTHNLDSAEYYYRKLQHKYMVADAYGGLLSVYKQRMNTDSIIKYAQLFEEGVKHEQDTLRIQTIHQMSSMYNYQRFLKKADAESRRAERLWYYLLLSALFLVLLILIAVVVSYSLVQKKRRQEEETKKIKKDYDEAIDKKNQLVQEMDILRANHEQLIASEQEAKSKLEIVKSNNNQLIHAKEKEISELNDKICDYAKRLLHSDKMIGGNPQFTLMIEEFHKKAERKRNTSLPTKQEWDQFNRFFAQTQPKAYAAIGREQTLSPQELKTCILILMKFANSEIISLLNVSPQNLTNIKTRINEKLFGESKASNLESKIKEIPIV